MKFNTLAEALDYKNSQSSKLGSNIVFWIDEKKDGFYVWCNFYD